jgi:hypothetical protein
MTTLDLDALEEQAKHASEAHDLATRNALLRTMSITYPELIFANHCREDVPALITECRRLREALTRIANCDFDEYRKWKEYHDSIGDDLGDLDWLCGIASAALHPDTTE